MSKTIKIPGRIESVETGKVVTGANAILDDTKGKKQNVINEETDAELLRLDQEKQGNLTFDQTPTEDSTNPVTSGGVYAAEQVLSQAIEAILLLIPSAASELNKLVDLATMNSSISTATALFKGTYNLVSDLHLTVSATHAQIAAALDALSLGADNNDYAFVQVPNTDTAPTDIAKTERYKFNGENWAYEYDLNNSGFTTAQWNAINSGITTLLVAKLSALPTNEALTLALAGKQDNLTFDNAPMAGSNNPVKSSGIYTRNNEIVELINALDVAKQNVLTFDTTPKNGSTNPVTSNGVYLAIQLVQTAVVALDGRMGTAETKISTAEGNIVNLQAAYAALTQSDIVVVSGALPSSGQQQNIIYRQPDQDHTPPQFYSDYMWNGTAWVLMATYNNAIDAEPTAGSHNLVESGGIAAYYGSYVQDTEYVEAKTDAEEKVLEGIRKDGTKVIGGDLEVGGNIINRGLQEKIVDAVEKTLKDVDLEALESITTIDSPEWIDVKTDKDGRIIEGITSDGKKKVMVETEIDGVNIKTLDRNIEEIKSSDILVLYPEKKILPLLSNYKLGGYQWGNNYTFDHENLTLLWFSDIHGNSDNLKRISDFYKKYKGNIDDVLSTGDFVLQNWDSDFSYWSNNGGGKFLNVIGNHEPWGTESYGYSLVSAKACYDRYFYPFIDTWNVEKVENKCYWYKDYPNVKSDDFPGGIRLISIDIYHWKETLHPINDLSQDITVYPDGTTVDTGEQETWFVNVLNDALDSANQGANKKAVIVALHGPSNSVTGVECSFDTLDPRASDSVNCMKQDMIQDVQDYIDAGGVFVAWISGHTHQDWFARLTNNPDQILLCIGTASYTMMYRDIVMLQDTMSMDKFDVLSIEPKNNFIRLFRIGSEYDRHGRHLGSLVYNFKNKELISNY